MINFGGFLFLIAVFNLIILFIVFKAIDNHYRKQFKVFTEELYRQYGEALEKIGQGK